ncbi:MAG: hypothetical protein M5U08_19140 [Burkholderiales bacterium]|nr:hypothetical protein [Burkholderiales bacterium]
MLATSAATDQYVAPSAASAASAAPAHTAASIVAAVAAVRQSAERPLQHRAAEHRRAHEAGDRGRLEPDPLHERWAHAPQRAADQPGGEGAGDAGGRDRIETAQPEMRHAHRLRLLDAGESDRNQREREEDRHDAEQNESGRIGGRDQHLSERERSERDRRVDREHLAAPVVRRVRVQPALDHHEEADQAAAVEHAQRRPQPRIDRERVHDRCGRGDRGEHREGADVAHAPDDRRTEERTEEKADEVRRHDEPDHHVREALQARAHAEQRAEQATAGDQDGDAEEQRGDRVQSGEHDREPVVPARAGMRSASAEAYWIPACAGMTDIAAACAGMTDPSACGTKTRGVGGLRNAQDEIEHRARRRIRRRRAQSLAARGYSGEIGATIAPARRVEGVWRGQPRAEAVATRVVRRVREAPGHVRVGRQRQVRDVAGRRHGERMVGIAARPPCVRPRPAELATDRPGDPRFRDLAQIHGPDD